MAGFLRKLKEVAFGEKNPREMDEARQAANQMAEQERAIMRHLQELEKQYKAGLESLRQAALAAVARTSAAYKEALEKDKALSLDANAQLCLHRQNFEEQKLKLEKIESILQNFDEAGVNTFEQLLEDPIIESYFPDYNWLKAAAKAGRMDLVLALQELKLKGRLRNNRGHEIKENGNQPNALHNDHYQAQTDFPLPWHDIYQEVKHSKPLILDLNTNAEIESLQKLRAEIEANLFKLEKVETKLDEKQRKENLKAELNNVELKLKEAKEKYKEQLIFEAKERKRKAENARPDFKDFTDRPSAERLAAVYAFYVAQDIVCIHYKMDKKEYWEELFNQDWHKKCEKISKKSELNRDAVVIDNLSLIAQKVIKQWINSIEDLGCSKTLTNVFEFSMAALVQASRGKIYIDHKFLKSILFSALVRIHCESKMFLGDLPSAIQSVSQILSRLTPDPYLIWETAHNCYLLRCEPNKVIVGNDLEVLQKRSKIITEHAINQKENGPSTLDYYSEITGQGLYPIGSPEIVTIAKEKSNKANNELKNDQENARIERREERREEINEERKENKENKENKEETSTVCKQIIGAVATEFFLKNNSGMNNVQLNFESDRVLGIFVQEFAQEINPVKIPFNPIPPKPYQEHPDTYQEDRHFARWQQREKKRLNDNALLQAEANKKQMIENARVEKIKVDNAYTKTREMLYDYLSQIAEKVISQSLPEVFISWQEVISPLSLANIAVTKALEQAIKDQKFAIFKGIKPEEVITIFHTLEKEGLIRASVLGGFARRFSESFGNQCKDKKYVKSYLPLLLKRVLSLSNNLSDIIQYVDELLQTSRLPFEKRMAHFEALQIKNLAPFSLESTDLADGYAKAIDANEVAPAEKPKFPPGAPEFYAAALTHIKENSRYKVTLPFENDIPSIIQNTQEFLFKLKEPGWNVYIYSTNQLSIQSREVRPIYKSLVANLNRELKEANVPVLNENLLQLPNLNLNLNPNPNPNPDQDQNNIIRMKQANPNDVAENPGEKKENQAPLVFSTDRLSPGFYYVECFKDGKNPEFFNQPFCIEQSSILAKSCLKKYVTDKKYRLEFTAPVTGKIVLKFGDEPEKEFALEDSSFFEFESKSVGKSYIKVLRKSAHGNEPSILLTHQTFTIEECKKEMKERAQVNLENVIFEEIPYSNGFSTVQEIDYTIDGEEVGTLSTDNRFIIPKTLRIDPTPSNKILDLYNKHFNKAYSFLNSDITDARKFKFLLMSQRFLKESPLFAPFIASLNPDNTWDREAMIKLFCQQIALHELIKDEEVGLIKTAQFIEGNQIQFPDNWAEILIRVHSDDAIEQLHGIFQLLMQTQTHLSTNSEELGRQARHTPATEMIFELARHLCQLYRSGDLNNMPEGLDALLDEFDPIFEERPEYYQWMASFNAAWQSGRSSDNQFLEILEKLKDEKNLLSKEFLKKAVQITQEMCTERARLVNKTKEEFDNFIVFAKQLKNAYEELEKSYKENKSICEKDLVEIREKLADLLKKIREQEVLLRKARHERAKSLFKNLVGLALAAFFAPYLSPIILGGMGTLAVTLGEAVIGSVIHSAVTNSNILKNALISVTTAGVDHYVGKLVKILKITDPLRVEALRAACKSSVGVAFNGGKVVKGIGLSTLVTTFSGLVLGTRFESGAVRSFVDSLFYGITRSGFETVIMGLIKKENVFPTLMYNSLCSSVQSVAGGLGQNAAAYYEMAKLRDARGVRAQALPHRERGGTRLGSSVKMPSGAASVKSDATNGVNSNPGVPVRSKAKNSPSKLKGRFHSSGSSGNIFNTENPVTFIGVGNAQGFSSDGIRQDSEGWTRMYNQQVRNSRKVNQSPSRQGQSAPSVGGALTYLRDSNRGNRNAESPNIYRGNSNYNGSNIHGRQSSFVTPASIPQRSKSSWSCLDLIMRSAHANELDLLKNGVHSEPNFGTVYDDRMRNKSTTWFSAPYRNLYEENLSLSRTREHGNYKFESPFQSKLNNTPSRMDTSYKPWNFPTNFNSFAEINSFSENPYQFKTFRSTTLNREDYYNFGIGALHSTGEGLLVGGAIAGLSCVPALAPIVTGAAIVGAAAGGMSLAYDFESNYFTLSEEFRIMRQDPHIPEQLKDKITRDSDRKRYIFEANNKNLRQRIKEDPYGAGHFVGGLFGTMVGGVVAEGIFARFGAAESKGISEYFNLKRANQGSLKQTTQLSCNSHIDIQYGIIEGGLNGNSQAIFKFSPGQDFVHFEKHRKHFENYFDNQKYSIQDYISDANLVLKNGIYAPEINAYVSIAGGKGSAKALVVGLNRASNEITTFHFKKVSDLEKLAPSLGWYTRKKSHIIDTIGESPELGWTAPYKRNFK